MCPNDSTGKAPEWPAPAGNKPASEYDPVCDMKVAPDSAAATSIYKGKKYYFCCIGCKIAFDKDPEKYLPKPSK